MGWKRLKEHFGIKHSIQVTNAGICIGSGYVSALVTIDPKSGTVHENPTFRNFLLEKYPALQEAKPEEIAKLIAAPDTFTSAIAVYTYEGGEIIEKSCEEPGWPNVTHDGRMMKEDTFSTDKAKAVAWAKRNATSAIKLTGDRIARAEIDLAVLRVRLAGFAADKEKLETDYPAIPAIAY